MRIEKQVGVKFFEIDNINEVDPLFAVSLQVLQELYYLFVNFMFYFRRYQHGFGAPFVYETQSNIHAELIKKATSENERW